MRRRTLAALMVVAVIGALSVLWAERDALADRAIRARLEQQPDMSFIEDRDHVRVMLCGTGSPEVSGARAQACTLVSAGGRMFLFDAGDGALRSLLASKIPVGRLERVFVTHFHSDHINDLGPLINQTWIWGRKTPLVIEGPVGMRRVIAGLAEAYALDEQYRSANMPHLAATHEAAFADGREIHIPGDGRPGTGGLVRVYDEGGVTIDAALVAHDPVRPAIGYVLVYKGKKVFISGDTEVSPVNFPAMQGADLVVHESYAAHMVRRAIPQMRALGMAFEAEVATRTIPYHADNLKLAEHAQRAGVKHLVLTHLIPWPDSFIVRHMYTEGMAQRFSGKLTVGEDGMVIVL